MKPRFLPIFGWIGAPGCDARNATLRLRAAEPLPGAAESDSERHVVVGPFWTCSGPDVSIRNGLAVSIRGDPIWRTRDARITEAGDNAQAALQAYQIHGPKILEILHGSFALVVIDTINLTSLLAVDRMGIERLAYCARGQELTFATSAERVARSCGAPLAVRAQSILSYLFFHMVPSPDTVFDGVRKIPPATAILCKTGTISEIRYWQPEVASSAVRAEDFASLKTSLDAALSAAVSAAHPDQHTGAFLSGGLDSSTVTGYLAKVTSRPPRTFSIGFGFDKYDELHYARIANAHFGCDWREYEVRSEDIVNEFALIAAQYDEPFGNASALPTLCCARMALNNGVEHLLAGDGGDELFAGNSRYADQFVFERYQRLPRVFRRRLLEPVLAAIPTPLRFGLLRKARGYVAQANTPLPARLESWNFLYRLGFDAMLDPDFIAAIDLSGPESHMRSVYSATSGPSPLTRMLQYDWRLTLADNDLRKVGGMCELAGVRVSYPMLHPDVIDVSLRVPAGLLMRRTHLRTFYKRAMRGFLPKEIIDKRKHGFGLPFGLWLRQSPRLAELIHENLNGLRARRIIRPQFLDQLVRLHREDDASHYGVLIWTLAMLEQWFREHRAAMN